MAASDVQLASLESKVDALKEGVDRLIDLQAKDHDSLVKLVGRVETACTEIKEIRKERQGDNSIAWMRVWQVATIALSTVAGFLGGLALWVVKMGGADK